MFSKAVLFKARVKGDLYKVLYDLTVAFPSRISIYRETSEHGSIAYIAITYISEQESFRSIVESVKSILEYDIALDATMKTMYSIVKTKPVNSVNFITETVNSYDDYYAALKSYGELISKESTLQIFNEENNMVSLVRNTVCSTESKLDDKIFFDKKPLRSLVFNTNGVFINDTSPEKQ